MAQEVHVIIDHINTVYDARRTLCWESRSAVYARTTHPQRMITITRLFGLLTI